MPRLPIHGLVLVAIVSLASSARAQAVDETEARMLFEAGNAAYQAGRYDDALERFQEALELTHRSIILWNVALAADRARRDELALETYRRFLAEVADSPQVHDNRVRAQARIEVLEQSVAEARASEENARIAEAQAREAELERQRAEQAELDAQQARAEAAQARIAAQRAEDSSRLVNKWWFWTIVGVGVAGAVAVPVTIASTRTTGTTFPATDHGNVVFALSGRF